MIFVCPKCDHRRMDPWPKRKGQPVCQGICFIEAMSTLPTMDAKDDTGVITGVYDTSDRPENSDTSEKAVAADDMKHRGDSQTVITPGRDIIIDETDCYDDAVKQPYRDKRKIVKKKIRKKKPAAKVVRKAGVKKKR